MYLQPTWLFAAFMAPGGVHSAAIEITKAACLAFPLYALFFVSAGFFPVDRPGWSGPVDLSVT